MAPFLRGQLDSRPSSPDYNNHNPLLDDVHSLAMQSLNSAHTPATSGIKADTSKLPAAAFGDLAPASTYDTDSDPKTSKMDTPVKIEKTVESKERAKIFAAAEKRAVAAAGRRNELLRIKHLQEIVSHAHTPFSAQFRKTAAMMKDIVRYWVKSAQDCDEPPLLHAISFGERKGERLTIQLKQVFALIPQKWQGWLHGCWISEWGSESWLDENLMNVLVHIAFPSEWEEHVAFGLSLGSLINDDVNELYKSDGCTGYLHHLVRNMVPNLPDPKEFKSEVKIFKFPTNIDSIVWFWNHDGMHWVTIKTEISDQFWRHHIYNSMEDNKEIRNWGGRIRAEVSAEIDDLERIITKVSGFARTGYFSELYKGFTPEQTNTNDCGAFTVYNTLCLLNEIEPDIQMTGDRCRAEFLHMILRALRNQYGDLPEESDDEDLIEATAPYPTLSRTSEPVRVLNIDPALKDLGDRKIETLWEDSDNAEASQTASLSPGKSSTNQPHELIPSSPPGKTMLTDHYDEEKKPTQADAAERMSRSRNSSPNTIVLNTPSSLPSSSRCHRIQLEGVKGSSPVADPSPQMAANPTPYISQIQENTLLSIANNINEPVDKNMEMDKPGPAVALGAIRSPPPPMINIPRVVSPRSVKFDTQPETNFTGLLRTSRPYTTKRASSPPPVYDATLPLASSSSLENICTTPPIYSAMDLPKPSPISQATGCPHIFPISKKLTLKEFTERIADMETLREHGFLTPRCIASLNKLTEDARERAIKRIVKRYKRSTGD